MTWVRRALTARARAEESRELYESLGFEVELRPVESSSDEPWDRDERCAGCRVSACDGLIVYTRRRTERD